MRNRLPFRPERHPYTSRDKHPLSTSRCSSCPVPYEYCRQASKCATCTGSRYRWGHQHSPSCHTCCRRYPRIPYSRYYSPGLLLPFRIHPVSYTRHTDAQDRLSWSWLSCCLSHKPRHNRWYPAYHIRRFLLSHAYSYAVQHRTVPGCLCVRNGQNTGWLYGCA